MNGNDFLHWEKAGGLPMVLCRCMTYGRPALLNEAVESFLRQDWPGPKRLYIYNDDPRVKYVFKHPEVKVVNLPERFPSIGSKLNHLVKSQFIDHPGALSMGWPDDDIMLPHAISMAMSKMVNCQAWYSCGRFAMKGPCIEGYRSAVNFAPVFSESFYRAVADHVKRPPFREDLESGEDKSFFYPAAELAATLGLPEFKTVLPPDQVYFLYRWGTGSYHVSARRNWQEIGKLVERTVKPGLHTIRPEWRHNYAALARAFLKKEADNAGL